MKIQYCSDLHLEFAQNALFLHKNPIKPIGDILVLAGDITYWGNKHFKHWFFDYVSEHFKQVYYIPGNHEFYTGKDIRILDKPVYEEIRSNVILVNNQVIHIDDVDLLFTTLWSHIPIAKSLFVEHGVNDFHQIKYNGNRFKSDQFNKFHDQSVEFLKHKLSESTAKHRIVVTHHIPTHVCNPEIYRDSIINSAFVVELYSLINEYNIDYWVYGHHHVNMPETEINGTKLVTNQLGYVHMGENHSYRNGSWFEI